MYSGKGARFYTCSKVCLIDAAYACAPAKRTSLNLFSTGTENTEENTTDVQLFGAYATMVSISSIVCKCSTVRRHVEHFPRL